MAAQTITFGCTYNDTRDIFWSQNELTFTCMLLFIIRFTDANSVIIPAAARCRSCFELRLSVSCQFVDLHAKLNLLTYMFGMIRQARSYSGFLGVLKNSPILKGLQILFYNSFLLFFVASISMRLRKFQFWKVFSEVISAVTLIDLGEEIITQPGKACTRV